MNNTTNTLTQSYLSKFRNTQLTPELLAKRAPSVFAQAPSGVSDKYQFIPTTRVLEVLDQENWKPYDAQQSRCKDPEGREFVKHALRFRNTSLAVDRVNVGDTIPELVLVNSHNGLSSFQLYAGLFRLACSNGLVVSSGSLAHITVRHVGFSADQIVGASRKVIDSIPALARQVETFQKVDLNYDEQLAFATQALSIRYELETAPIESAALLRARRTVDNKSDLWSTFNRVQENLVLGGLKYISRTKKVDDNGHEYDAIRRNSTRAISSVDANLTTNKKLWELLDSWAQKKA